MKQTTQFFLEGESPTLKTMYKTRNTGTGNGMWERGECGECYIPGNLAKHSGECPQTFWEMSPNIPGNIFVTQGNEDAGSVRRFHLVVFVFGVNQEN